MKKAYFFLALHIISLMGLTLVSTTSHAEEILKNFATRQSVGNRVDDSLSVHDGPYVFWIGEYAIVQYVCSDEVITHKFEAKDEIQIPASCVDSSRTLLIKAEPPALHADTFSGVTKICAISDIHGKYDQMIKLLVGNGVIDEDLHWSWRNGHLVITGDIFDRGAEVNDALWLVYQLEQEAREAGGQVHMLLGNHEIMVLRGDLRYVHKKYIGVSKKLRIKIPDLYGPETELGRWLRSKNVAMKINDILFLHAGISPKIPKRGYTIPMINDLFRNSIDARDYIIQFDEELDFFYRYEGPIWYRGYLRTWQNIPAATGDEIQSILDTYLARYVVVGHTFVDQIASLHGGKIFTIETGMNKGAEGEALIWERGVFYRSDVRGKREVLGKKSN